MITSGFPIVPWLIGGLVFASVLALLVFALFVSRRVRPVANVADNEPHVDIGRLSDQSPHGLAPRLTLYHQPVRLALVVIAPVGRDKQLPRPAEMPSVVEALMPGLFAVMSAHQPEYQPWPAQLSVAGFGGFFSHCVPLPGRHGKGTPWSSVVGPFEYNGDRYLAGIVVRSASDNSIGELSVEHPGQWLDIFRIVEK